MSEPLDYEPSLYRVTVVVDLDDPAADGLEGAVAAALPLDLVPAMADEQAREDAATLSTDRRALDVVVLAEGGTPAEAERTGVAAVEAALRGAGLGPSTARPGQARVEDAYEPGAPAAR
ncbi:hypothetical protein [Quadrisphaera sp. DSM 44207]|uniref:hypothetical protein n=1 Tax=Quadrisphaera sp. DSM 44207 TaxID=1881057 RepID=UPI00088E8A33|nr:hypothetical protein [Quadrisphaera sp. DSM 44207]SDQ22014.1 hypothetical protein SAMN05428996_1144 [Quadrisphaera sp. DSM 44207]